MRLQTLEANAQHVVNAMESRIVITSIKIKLLNGGTQTKRSGASLNTKVRMILSFKAY
jgi:hypothetical protein